MKAKGIISILAIVGLLLFVAVSVLSGGGKGKATSTSTALRRAEGNRYSVELPGGTRSVPDQINYQGYLVNSSDTSAVTDILDMTFEIFDDPIYGYPLWSETHDSVEVTNGLFNVLLRIPDTLFTGRELWLQTKIEEEFLWPRKKLVSVPYGYRSGVADRADQATRADSAFYALYSDTAEYALSATPDADWVISGDNIYRLNGNVGIGTMSPTTALHINRMFAPLGNFYSYPAIIESPHHYAYPIIRSESQASILFHAALYPVAWGIGRDEILDGIDIFSMPISSGWPDVHNRTSRMAITNNGNVGIGTTEPNYKLDVEGDVQAHAYHTGDIFFQKDGQKLWRMFEDENGLYLENVKTGKVYRFVLQEVER